MCLTGVQHTLHCKAHILFVVMNDLGDKKRTYGAQQLAV